MTLETSAQSFEDQIVNHKARIIEVIKHKTLDHKDYYTVHTTSSSLEKQVFENIGQLLLFQCLQKTKQLEEYAGSLFGSDLKSFLKNGYMIKEYHVGPDGENYTVTVQRINASHILVGVSEGDLAECLAVTEPSELKLKNVLHLGFQDAIDQGYTIVEYKKHSGNENFSVQVKLRENVKSFGNISRSHLASVLKQSEDSLLDTFGEHVQATETAKRSASFSPRSKISLESAIKSGGKVVSSHPHQGNSDLWAVQIKTDDGSIHKFATVTRKHLESIPGFEASQRMVNAEE